MEEISPDIEQWLLQDTQVVNKWSLLARHIDLDGHLLHCQDMGDVGRKQRRGSRERNNLEMMLRAWKNKSPESYNIHTLKTILLAEGLYDMWMWINIITQSNTRSLSSMSSLTPSPTPSSTWSRYLYSTQNMLHTSPTPYTESDYAYSLSSGESRPSSQLSDYKANTSTSTTSPILYRPDLIKLSSPRHWIRLNNEERSRHVSSESTGCDLSVLSDKWDSLEIIEDKNKYLSANEELGENTKHAVTSIDHSSMTEEQSSSLDSQNLKKFGTTDKFCGKNDRDVIDRVNKMNTELQYKTMMKADKRKEQGESKKKKVKFENSDEYEKQFDFILGMIEEAVENLNV